MQGLCRLFLFIGFFRFVCGSAEISFILFGDTDFFMFLFILCKEFQKPFMADCAVTIVPMISCLILKFEYL